jgi:hypothetical protein
VNIQIFNPAVNMPNSSGAMDVSGRQVANANTSATNTLPVQQSTPSLPPTAPSPWGSIPQGSVYNNNNEVNNNINYPAPQYPAYPYPVPQQIQYPPYPAYAAYPPAQLPVPQIEAKPEEDKSKINTEMEKKKVVVLTDNYIRSLENYLNNPNRDVRLHAAREIVNRFEEDSSRFDDPALNALLNKMLQDPQGSIRGIALSLVSTGAAQGNNYTAQLLNVMKENKSNKEDALQASEALLRMATKTETINVPKQLPPPVKEGANGNNA